MRWYCLDPQLPSKAVLRIRAAPDSSAAVCGRVAKGRAIAVCAPEFLVHVDREGSDGTAVDTVQQRWLHVSFRDEESREMIEGFVMARLPDGMKLLVPWEHSGMVGVCQLRNERALVYDQAVADAQPLGLANAGEGTAFPFGMLASDENRVCIFHDEHDEGWVDATDVDVICTRMAHPPCSVPHSYFTLNDQLPSEAQIAIRKFPSKEAETVALLSRGETIEVVLQSGDWLQLAGPHDAWIMRRTDTWQLLAEVPHHSSGQCRHSPSAVATNGGHESIEPIEEPVNGSPGRDSSQYHGSQTASDDVDMDVPSSDNWNISSPKAKEDPSFDQVEEQLERIEDEDVSDLCEDMATNDISGIGEDDDEEIDEAEQPMRSDSVPDQQENLLSWEDRPLNVNRRQSEDVQDEEGLVVEDHIAVDPATVPESKVKSCDDRSLNVRRQQTEAFDGGDVDSNTQTSSSSWEDRPLNVKHQKSAVTEGHENSFAWDEQPINQPHAEETSVEEDETLADDNEIAACGALDDNAGEVDVTEQPMHEDVASESPVNTLSWEDRPLNVNRRQSRDAEDAVAGDIGSSNFDRIAHASDSSWDDRPLDVGRQQAGPSDVENSANTSSSSWDERPLYVKHQHSFVENGDATLRNCGEAVTLHPQVEHTLEEEAAAENGDFTDATHSFIAEEDPLNVNSQPSCPGADEDDGDTDMTEAEVDTTNHASAHEAPSFAWDERPLDVKHRRTLREDACASRWDDEEESNVNEGVRVGEMSDNGEWSIDSHQHDEGDANVGTSDGADQYKLAHLRADENGSDDHHSNTTQLASDDGCDDNTNDGSAQENWSWDTAPISSRHAQKHIVGTGDRHPANANLVDTNGSARNEGSNESTWRYMDPETLRDAKQNARNAFNSQEYQDTASNSTAIAALNEEPVQSYCVNGRSTMTAPPPSASGHSSGNVTPTRGRVERAASGDLIRWIDEDDGPGNAFFVIDEEEDELGASRSAAAFDDYHPRVPGPGQLETPYETQQHYHGSTQHHLPSAHIDAIHRPNGQVKKRRVMYQYPRDVSAEMKRKLASLPTDRSGYKLFRAIANNYDADVVLEVLARESTDADINGWLKYEPAHFEAKSPHRSTVNAFSTHTNGDGFKTPTKKSPEASNGRRSLESWGSPKSRRGQATFNTTRATARDTTESAFNLIAGGGVADPDAILVAEFGRYKDELGLFARYQYPVVSSAAQPTTRSSFTTTRSPSAIKQVEVPTRVRTHSSVPNISFNSPPPASRANSLKRERSPVPVTPPARVAASVEMPQADTRPRAGSAALTRPRSALAPPSTVASPTKPRASLIGAPSKIGLPRGVSSNLRPPSSSTLLPAPGFAKPRLSMPATTRLRATSQLAPPPPPMEASSTTTSRLSQPSMQRRSLLPTPSPTKRTIQRASSTAASVTGNPLRASFGFSRAASTTTRK